MTPLGHHLLLELHGCPSSLLSAVEPVRVLMEVALDRAGATRISSHFHQFEPHGVSGVAILAESHATIHTWPEHGYAAVDVFTCGRPDICQRIPSLLREALQATSCDSRILERGSARDTPAPPHPQTGPGPDRSLA
jgi:S-adenosylmethionine decarboxylase